MGMLSGLSKTRKGFFSKLKEKFVGEDISSEILEGSKREDYVELDAGEKGSDILTAMGMQGAQG